MTNISRTFTFSQYVCAKCETVYIEQIYTKCLSEATYYIESNGYAAVIDPLREVQPYIALAKRRGAEIVYVFKNGKVIWRQTGVVKADDLILLLKQYR